MIIREISASEYETAARIFTLAFVRSRSSFELPPGDERYKDHLCAFDDAGKMTAMLRMTIYDLRLNGCDVRACGIGSVCSLAEHRKAGGVPELLTEAIVRARRNGAVISLLNPFSYEYYRRFGYANCTEKVIYRLPTEKFRRIKQPCSVSQYMPGMDIRPFAEIYEAFCGGINLMPARKPSEWEALLGKNPYTDYRYVYLMTGADGIPCSYIVFDAERPPLERSAPPLLNVRDYAFTLRDGLHSILALIGVLSPQFKEMTMEARPGFDLPTLLPEPDSVVCEKHPFAMARVLDVPAVLETLRLRDGEETVINVDDPLISENKGCFMISCRAGKTHVQRTGKPFDASMSIDALSQLATGYLGFDEAVNTRSDIEIAAERSIINIIFEKKRVYTLIDY